MSTDDADDHALARRLAERAGTLLLGLRASGRPDLGAAGDRVAHEWLMQELQRCRPADRVLSEESAGHQPGRGHGRVWIVDPLDGTREYAESDRPDWAVHVALVVDGRPAAGAVALPAQGRVLATSDAWPVPARPDRPVRLLVSRTRPAPHAQALAAALGAELVPMGSAGAKAMAVVLGDADVYAHAGGQYEWDSAAPVAVALAAGFHASRLDGTSLRYDRPEPWLPDLLVCRPDLADRVLAATRDTAP